MQRGTLQHSGRGLQRPPFRLAPPREVPALPPSEVPQEQPLGPPPEFPRGVLMTINEPPRQAAQDHLIKPMPAANRPPLRTRSMVPLVLSAALQN